MVCLLLCVYYVLLMCLFYILMCCYVCSPACLYDVRITYLPIYYHTHYPPTNTLPSLSLPPTIAWFEPCASNSHQFIHFKHSQIINTPNPLPS